MEVVKDDLLGLLVDLFLLAKDDAALALDRARLEEAALENVGDDLDALADVAAEALGVVDRLLTARVRVQVRAEVLDLELEAVLGALPGALERHVLEEVRNARGRRRLGARASVDPDADGRRLGVRRRLGRDGEPVGQGRDLGERQRARRREVAAERGRL